MSSFTRDLYSKSGIEMKATTAYRPQSNGEAERVNQEVGTYLRMYCAEKPDDWSLFLADAQFAHNSHIHSTHGQTPDRKSTRLNSSHGGISRMPSSA